MPIYERRPQMKHTITSAAELGMIIRAVRKSTAVRQDDLAAIVGVSRQFAVDVEGQADRAAGPRFAAAQGAGR